MKFTNVCIRDDWKSLKLKIISRGTALQLYDFRGECYIEATSGVPYSIFLKNEDNKPLEVIVSVDGCDISTLTRADIKSTKPCTLSPFEEKEFGAWNGGRELLKFLDPRNSDEVRFLPHVRRGLVGVIAVAIIGQRDVLKVHYRTREWLIDKLIMKDDRSPILGV